MGVEYALLNPKTKTYIDLGKSTVNGFQMPSNRIIGFASVFKNTAADEFAIVADTGEDWPRESQGWLCVDRYYDDPPAKDDIGAFIYRDELHQRLIAPPRPFPSVGDRAKTPLGEGEIRMVDAPNLIVMVNFIERGKQVARLFYWSQIEPVLPSDDTLADDQPTGSSARRS